MKLQITITCDNDAFSGDNLGFEIARILTNYANSIKGVSQEADYPERYLLTPEKLRDINGNTVGSIRES